jgi:hypothetical protein
MSAYRKDLAAFCKEAGWLLEPTNGGHLKLRHPDADEFIIAAKSPRGGTRALRNTVARARRLLRPEPHEAVPLPPAASTPLEPPPQAAPASQAEPEPLPFRSAIHDTVAAFWQPLMDKPGEVGWLAGLTVALAPACRPIDARFDIRGRPDLLQAIMDVLFEPFPVVLLDEPLLIRAKDDGCDVIVMALPHKDLILLTMAAITADGEPVRTAVSAHVRVSLDCAGPNINISIPALTPVELRKLGMPKVMDYNKTVQREGMTITLIALATLHALQAPGYRKVVTGDLMTIDEPAPLVVELQRPAPFGVTLVQGLLNTSSPIEVADPSGPGDGDNEVAMGISQAEEPAELLR